ncbi:MAG: hypothetical protein D6706_19770, partial [Chloroflexi bacterium]
MQHQRQKLIQSSLLFFILLLIGMNCQSIQANNRTYYAASTGSDGSYILGHNNLLYLNEVTSLLGANSAAFDFNRQADSPAVAAGEILANSGAVDFAGNPRSQTGAIDMGALELTAVSPTVYLPLITT